MDEFIFSITGGYTPSAIATFFWFFIIGYVIYALIETSGRDVNSKSTPREWSWMFWFKDNWRRYLTTILCTYVLFIFYDEFIGHGFNNFEALLVGLVGDGISAFAKKKIGMLQADRVKLMEKE